jgi:hypothetical protein
VGLITGNCPLNKHLHNMGLIDEPICIACGMEDESEFHLLCNCLSLISDIFEVYGRRMRLHCCDSRWQVADLLFLLDSFILMNTCSFCTVLFYLFVYLSLFDLSIFHLCGAY